MRRPRGIGGRFLTKQEIIAQQEKDKLQNPATTNDESPLSSSSETSPPLSLLSPPSSSRSHSLHTPQAIAPYNPGQPRSGGEKRKRTHPGSSSLSQVRFNPLSRPTPTPHTSSTLPASSSHSPTLSHITSTLPHSTSTSTSMLSHPTSSTLPHAPSQISTSTFASPLTTTNFTTSNASHTNSPNYLPPTQTTQEFSETFQSQTELNGHFTNSSFGNADELPSTPPTLPTLPPFDPGFSPTVIPSHNAPRPAAFAAYALI